MHIVDIVESARHKYSLNIIERVASQKLGQKKRIKNREINDEQLTKQTITAACISESLWNEEKEIFRV